MQNIFIVHTNYCEPTNIFFQPQFLYLIILLKQRKIMNIIKLMIVIDIISCAASVTTAVMAGMALYAWKREFVGIVIFFALGVLINNFKRKLRRDYYRNDYLKSDAWQRKRYLVLKRDNWRCVYCGARATQVHHLKYAKNIGREPIDWLVPICDECHKARH